MPHSVLILILVVWDIWRLLTLLKELLFIYRTCSHCVNNCWIMRKVIWTESVPFIKKIGGHMYFYGQLMPHFRTFGDISSGFQSRSGQLWEGHICTDLLMSSMAAGHCSPHTCFSNSRMPDLNRRPLRTTDLTQLTIQPPAVCLIFQEIFFLSAREGWLEKWYISWPHNLILGWHIAKLSDLSWNNIFEAIVFHFLNQKITSESWPFAMYPAYSAPSCVSSMVQSEAESKSIASCLFLH